MDDDELRFDGNALAGALQQVPHDIRLTIQGLSWIELKAAWQIGAALAGYGKVMT
jgi:hypothetical protein